MEANQPEKITERPSQETSDSQALNQDDFSQDDQDNPLSLLSDEVVEKIPPEARKEVLSMMRVYMGMGSFSSGSPLAKRITSQHIDKLIDSNEKENEREYQKFRSSEVTKRLAVAAIILLVLMVLIYSGFTKDLQLSEKIITAGISALGGFGVGYAVGKKNN
jgi:hypothetical protein